MADNLDEIKKKIEEFKAKSVLASDMTAFLALVLNIIAKTKTSLETSSKENIKEIQNAVAWLEQEHTRMTANVTRETSGTKDEVLEKLKTSMAEMKRAFNEAMLQKPKDADEEKIVEKVLERIPPAPPFILKTDDIRDRLESLEGDERLDKSAIKGLELVVTQTDLDKAISILDQRTIFLINKAQVAQSSSPAGSVSWGGILGTLSDQTDLQTALNAKQPLDTQLTDLAGLSYAGNGLKVIRVKADETGWELATISAGGGDMVLADVQTVTGLKTFDKDKLAMKGTSTGVTVISTANTGASDFTAILQAGNGTIAYLTDIPSLTGYVTTDQTIGQTIGATGARLTKLWATDITVTNAIVGGVTGNAGTATALQNARTIGGVSFDGTANITVATATGGFTVSGGALALGANNLTMTGSLGATGARVTKGWFTDIESTNMPTVGGTSLSSTFEALANKATDFSTLNNTLYPTTQAVSDYVATAVIGLLDYRGSYDASTNLFPATGGSGVLGAILKGDFWICSVAGTLGGVAVTAGDLIIAIVDTPGQTSTNWDLIAHNLGSYVTSIAGTANQVIASSSTGAVTLSLPQSINTTANVTFNQVTAALVGNASTATALQNARTIGGVSFDGTANITVATATGGFTVSGGNLALGANSLTLTGSIGATGARATKVWTADLESTNMPTIGGTSLTTVAQTLQNKTLTNSNNVLGAVTMTLGSDADGDIYFRSSNLLTRLAKGTGLQQLRMNAGATAPEWATISGGDPYALSAKPTTYFTYVIPWFARSDSQADDNFSGWTVSGYTTGSEANGFYGTFITTGGNSFMYTYDNSSGGIPGTGATEALTFSGSKKMVLSFRFKGDSSGNWCVGLGTNANANWYTPNTAAGDRAVFTYDGATFRTLTDDGSTKTSKTVSATVTNWLTLRIELDPGSECRFYIDGSLVATHSSSENLPNGGNVLVGHGHSASAKTYRMTQPTVAVEL